jgi:hypothetical protein
MAQVQVLGPDQFMAFFITAGLASSAVRALTSQSLCPREGCEGLVLPLPPQSISAAHSTKLFQQGDAVCRHTCEPHAGMETVTCVCFSVCVAGVLAPVSVVLCKNS